MITKLCVVIDHQNKSAAYSQALRAAGYHMTDRIHASGIRFLLSDADWRWPMMDEAQSRDIPVFLYPHAARPMVQYDGCIEPRPVRCMFTHAEGGAEIMRKIGYPYPVEVTGWAYSDVRPFRVTPSVSRILFAPIHPNANGYLNKVDKDLNWRTLFRLLGYCRETGTRLSVRLIGEPKQNGIADLVNEVEQVGEIHRGKKNNSTADMESADVVVAHQTFAYIAVALGKPTVMMGEDVPPRTGNTEDGFRYVDHWDDYKADLMFPLDILAEDPAEVIAKAAAGCPAVEAWKARYIGRPFDGPAFVAKLESYL